MWLIILGRMYEGNWGGIPGVYDALIRNEIISSTVVLLSIQEEITVLFVVLVRRLGEIVLLQIASARRPSFGNFISSQRIDKFWYNI
jgi:hypothetical protein